MVQESDPGQVVCFVDYAYGDTNKIALMIEYFNGIRHRIPYVMDVMTKFVAKLKEFNLVQSMDQIASSGFCLGVCLEKDLIMITIDLKLK